MLFVNQRVRGEMHVAVLAERLGFDVCFVRGCAEEDAALGCWKERGNPIYFVARVGQLPKIKTTLCRRRCLIHLTFGIDRVAKCNDPFCFSRSGLPERAQGGQS